MTTSVGSYATANRSWLAAAAVTPPKGSRPRAKRGEIVYPFFEEVARVTDDPYWSDYFLKFARGVFFKPLSYDGRELIFSKRAAGALKPTAKLLLPPNPHEASLLLRRFLAEHTHKSSERDRKQMQAQAAPTGKNCSAAKRKQQLQEHVESFIHRLATYMNLSPAERINLSTILHAGFLLKHLTVHDVHYNESGISTIDGLHFDHVQRQFYIDPQRIRHPPRSSSKSTRKTRANAAQEYWFGFLDSYRSLQHDSSVVDRSTSLHDGVRPANSTTSQVSYTPSAD